MPRGVLLPKILIYELVSQRSVIKKIVQSFSCSGLQQCVTPGIVILNIEASASLESWKDNFSSNSSRRLHSSRHSFLQENVTTRSPFLVPSIWKFRKWNSFLIFSSQHWRKSLLVWSYVCDVIPYHLSFRRFSDSICFKATEVKPSRLISIATIQSS